MRQDEGSSYTRPERRRFERIGDAGEIALRTAAYTIAESRRIRRELEQVRARNEQIRAGTLAQRERLARQNRNSTD